MGRLAINDDLLGRIEKLAQDSHMPVEQKAEELLRESMARRERAASFRHIAQSVAAMTSKGVVQTDSVELLRQDRNR